MKKIISLILCLMMVLAVASPVFAEERTNHTHTITIANDNVAHPTYVYKAYQVFSGVLDETGVLSNIKWGSGVNGTALLAALKTIDAYKDCNDAEDVAAVLAKDAGHDNAVAVAFADLVSTYTVKKGDEDIEANRTYPYLNTANAKTSTFNDATKKYEIEVEGDGYYLVINTTIPVDAEGNVTENTTFSRHILQVVRDITISHKGTFPTSGKVINENGDKKNVNEASIGDVIDFDIWGTLPSNIAFYDTYFYRFNDTMSKGLTFNNDVKVTIKNAGKPDVDVTQYFWIGATKYDAVNGTQITIAIQDLLALRHLTDANGDPVVIDAHTQVVVDYTATLNENAVIGVEGNPNILDLDFSNNPNVDGDPSQTPPPPPGEEPPVPQYPIGETPDHKTITYTTELKIPKVNGKNDILPGAEFTLTGNGVNIVLISGDFFRPAVLTGDADKIDAEPTGGWYYLLLDGTYTQVEPKDDDPATEDVNEGNKEAYHQDFVKFVREDFAIVDSEKNTITNVKAFVDETTGVLKFTGLGAGTYTLTETVTPKGFNTCEPIVFEILFNEETKTFSSSNNEIDLDVVNGVFTTTVINEAGSKLPTTGGMGTTLFYVFGGIMVLAAVVLLVTKKRMNA